MKCHCAKEPVEGHGGPWTLWPAETELSTVPKTWLLCFYKEIVLQFVKGMLDLVKM